MENDELSSREYYNEERDWGIRNARGLMNGVILGIASWGVILLIVFGIAGLVTN